jgi:hypothetical protein
MTSPSEHPGGHASDGCAELRAALEASCAEAHAASTLHEAANERTRARRRDLVAAEHRHAEAVAAADPAGRAAEKAAARDTYRLAKLAAEGDDQVREATADYAQAIDRINRAGRMAQRAAHEAKVAVDAAVRAVQSAEREEQAARLRADQAQAGCMDARVRLATCEERAQAPPGEGHATVFEPHAATGGHAVAVSEGGPRPPLVIEAMVGGDREALALAAARVAEHTGMPRAEVQIQLQELVDAIVSTASHDGYLVFDARHRFWSALTFEEARDVIGALDRLGFVFEPSEGWHADRAPSPSDMSMALAYAGLDARNMRGLPDAGELLELPGSIGVDARAFLAARAPDLAVDHLMPLLDRGASRLEPLWNEWGQVRPILLSDRHALGPGTA